MLPTKDFSFLSSLGVDFYPAGHLSQYTTFQLGGPCLGIVMASTPLQLEPVIKVLKQNHLDFILLGEGSNILASDHGIQKIVVRYLTQRPEIQRKDNSLFVSGSTLLDDLVEFTVENGLEGLSFASGIPGTVGGAIVGNAGAFGKQIGDFVESVEILDRQGNKWREPSSSLGFQYRHSKFKENDHLLLSACFRLLNGDRAMLMKERTEILETRKEKHPDYKKFPTAGSFFKNVEPTSKADRRQAAGWFLEQVGAKSFSQNGATTFEKHANILIKKGPCTAQDVLDLSLRMEKAVEEKFGFCLIREVRLLGEFKGLPAHSHADFR